MNTLNRRYEVITSFRRQEGFKRPYMALYWRLKCQCGVIFEKRNERLNETMACKSCTISINSNSKKGGKYLTIPNYSVKRRKYFTYLRRAKSKNLEFELSEEDCFKLFDECCYYCATLPKPVASTFNNGNTIDGHFISNGIDRRDNSKGYTLSNSVACCEFCNKAKLDRTEKEFLEWIADVYVANYSI